MNKLILFTFALPILMNAQQQTFLDADASDPKKMGWMQGFPPLAEKTVSALDGSFFQFPALRYSVCHMREFLPTVNVPASTIPMELSESIDNHIGQLTFTPLGEKSPMNFEASLKKNYTDDIIILHRGKVVYEKYFGELTPDGIHAVMSVSKTFTGTLAATLIAEGILDENKRADFYVPELKNSAFGNATVRQILDMTTNLQYSEDYANPKAEVFQFSAAGNPFAPKKKGEPANYYDYLKTVKAAGPHQQAFGYKTINTDAMGWIISRVTGKSIPQLLSERIWQKIGAKHDGYYQVDGSGIAFAGGGFNANLRDLAKFGEMIRNKGYYNGQQILPEAAVEDIMKGGSKELFAKAGFKTLPGWSYRNMWWVTHNADGAFAARGVHGQTVYVDPKAEMVLVRLASHPTAGNAANDPYSLPAYQAVADYLKKK